MLLLYILQGMKLPSDIVVQPGQVGTMILGSLGVWVAMFNQRRTPAQVLLAWAVQRGTALLTTPRTAARARENFNISALPEDALEEINRIQNRQRFNE
jgi:alcohol dehydrogenase (NADP+)